MGSSGARWFMLALGWCFHFDSMTAGGRLQLRYWWHRCRQDRRGRWCRWVLIQDGINIAFETVIIMNAESVRSWGMSPQGCTFWILAEDWWKDGLNLWTTLTFGLLPDKSTLALSVSSISCAVDAWNAWWPLAHFGWISSISSNNGHPFVWYGSARGHS